MQLGAFVTTHQRPSELMRTLQILESQTRRPDHMLVVDNAPSRDAQHVVNGFSPEWISYHAMGENLGPAGAAAYALERLSREGYDWIYCGDDDDPPQSSDTIERLMHLALSTGDTTGAVGAVGARWDWKKGEMERIPDGALQGVVGVDMIGGGQHFILRSEVVRTVGVPDGRFFFGLDDLEYCLRIRRAGYRLLVDGAMMLEQRARNGRLNFVRRRSPYPRHSFDTIWRQYYSTRNYIFAMTRTLQHPELARREFGKALARSSCSWRRGPAFGLAFTRLQLRGVIDGYLGRMGRTILPAAKRTHPAPPVA